MASSIDMVGTLSAGTIAMLLEFFALAMGLVIAANLQAIVTLTARRRLFVRGRATLRDTTWGLNITDGLSNPRKMLKDWRSVFAFSLALIVLVLEALTVLQTQPGDSCSFQAESTWNIEKQKLGCYEYSSAEELGLTSHYFAQALEKVSDVDVDVGIPVNTDVFENSILTGASVNSLKSREESYVAPIVQAGTASSVKVRRNAHSVQSATENDSKRGVVDCTLSEALTDSDPPVTASIDLEVTDVHSDVMSAGFVLAEGCGENLNVAVCRHARTAFGFVDLVEVDAECDLFEISREGVYGKNDLQFAQYVATSKENSKDIGEEELRRGVLANIVARNSASQTKCERYIAAPKPCTEIGWVSLGAVLGLAVIFLGTTVARLLLKCMVAQSVDWSGDQERLVRSIFEHFDAVPRSYKPKRDDDIHVSVLSSARDLDQFHLVWTREPVQVEPARLVARSQVVPTPEAYDDDDESPLV